MPVVPKVSTATQTKDEHPKPKTQIVREDGDGPSVVVESRSSPTVEKSRSYIKLGSYSGETLLLSFLNRFEVCSRQNGWTALNRLNQLCALTDGASQLTWEA